MEVEQCFGKILTRNLIKSSRLWRLLGTIQKNERNELLNKDENKKDQLNSTKKNFKLNKKLKKDSDEENEAKAQDQENDESGEEIKQEELFNF